MLHCRSCEYVEKETLIERSPTLSYFILIWLCFYGDVRRSRPASPNEETHQISSSLCVGWPRRSYAGIRSSMMSALQNDTSKKAFECFAVLKWSWNFWFLQRQIVRLKECFGLTLNSAIWHLTTEISDHLLSGIFDFCRDSLFNYRRLWNIFSRTS